MREMMLIEAIKQLDDEELVQYLKQEIENQGRRPNSNNVKYDSKERMRKIIMQKEKASNNTSLHLALALQKSNEVIMKLIDIGGKQLVMEKNNLQMTALHYVCHNSNNRGFRMRGRRRNSSNHTTSTIDVVSKMLDVGGRDLVMEENCHQWTALHYACYSNAPIEVVSKLIKIGGKNLVKATSFRNCTALHFILFNPDSYDQYKVKYREGSSTITSNKHLVVVEMIKQSILAEIGGQFGIGGLFHYLPGCDQDQIYKRWDDFAPSLEKAIISIEEEHQQNQPSMLHAAITAGAPRYIISDIINRFDNILTRDSHNSLLPIEVAIKHKLEWNKGMKEIIEATALRQKRTVIHVAAQYGLQWDNHMETLIEKNIDKVACGRDNLTGLRLFMLAAMGDYYDLNAIFSMAISNPGLLDIMITKY